MEEVLLQIEKFVWNGVKKLNRDEVTKTLNEKGYLEYDDELIHFIIEKWYRSDRSDESGEETGPLYTFTVI